MFGLRLGDFSQGVPGIEKDPASNGVFSNHGRGRLDLQARDFRVGVEQFGAEMTSVFEQASAEQLKKGRLAFVRFVLRELAGLSAGARDARKAPSLLGDLAVDFSVPSELADAQRTVRRSRELVQKAIAAHDFKRARFLCLVDERARAEVVQLRAKYRLPDS